MTGLGTDPGTGPLDTLVAALPALRARDLTRFKAPSDGSGRRSGVLLLFGSGGPGASGAGPDLVLIERARMLRAHAGQPAFPGGAVDPEDADATAAALREAQEEVGLDLSTVEVVGALPELFLPATRFLVTPVVAWWRSPHALHPASVDEVAVVGRVAVADLADPDNRWTLTHPSGYQGPAFDVRTAEGASMLVWGFTAGVISGLLRLGGWERPWDPARSRELPPAAAELAARSASQLNLPPGYAPETYDDEPVRDGIGPPGGLRP